MKNKKGFTLMELMVSLSISMLLVPGILMTNLFLNKSMICGFEKNTNIGKVRIFDEFFDKQISLSQQSKLKILNNENVLSFTRYDKSSGTWNPSSFIYNETTKKLSYTYGGNTKVWLENVRPKTAHDGVFSLSNRIAQCHLIIGRTQPDYFKNLTVNLETSATPRNP
jgi:hypothetical protein